MWRLCARLQAPSCAYMCNSGYRSVQQNANGFSRNMSQLWKLACEGAYALSGSCKTHGHAASISLKANVEHLVILRKVSLHMSKACHVHQWQSKECWLVLSIFINPCLFLNQAFLVLGFNCEAEGGWEGVGSAWAQFGREGRGSRRCAAVRGGSPRVGPAFMSAEARARARMSLGARVHACAVWEGRVALFWLGCVQAGLFFPKLLAQGCQCLFQLDEFDINFHEGIWGSQGKPGFLAFLFLCNGSKSQSNRSDSPPTPFQA